MTKLHVDIDYITHDEPVLLKYWRIYNHVIKNAQQVENDIQTIIPEFSFDNLYSDQIQQLSDSSKRFIELILTCCMPLTNTLVVEQPEKGLHPTAIQVLIKYLKIVDKKREDLFLITNSDYFWNTELNIAGQITKFYMRLGAINETIRLYQITPEEFLLVIKRNSELVKYFISDIFSLQNLINDRYGTTVELGKKTSTVFPA